MRGASRLLPVLLVALAVIPHIGALRNEFVFDDTGVIVQNDSITRFDPRAIWTSPYWPTIATAHLYRPLTSTSYAVDWAVGGGSPTPFVATNLLLHAAATLAAVWLLRRLFPRQNGLAWAAGILFAVHPIHCEAVVGIVGRAEILAALLSLVSYALWIRAEASGGGFRRLLPPLLWTLALLSKEGAVALPALLLTHRLGILAPASPKRRMLIWDAAWPIGLVAVLLLRWSALGGLTTPAVGFIDNPLASLHPLLRALGAGGVLAGQLLQIVTGRGFSADYSYAQVEPGGRLYAAGAAMLLALTIAAIAAYRRGRRGAEGWGVAFFLSFWLVTSNVLIAIGTVQADRLFYLPLLGLLATAVSLAMRIPRRFAPRYALLTLLLLLTVRYGIASFLQTRDWRDNRTLFAAAVREAPRSVKARSNLAAVMLHDHSAATAREVLELIEPAREYGKGYGPLIQREAKARMFLGERERAATLFRAAVRAQADSAEVLVELGNLAIMAGDGEEALACFDLVAGTGRKTDHVRIGRSSALSIMGRYDEAAEGWLEVIEALPDSIPARVACAWNLREAGRAGEAAAILREALADAEDARLLDALARALLAGAGTPGDALAAAGRAVALLPSEEHRTTLALAQVASGLQGEAIETLSGIRDRDLIEEIESALAGAAADSSGDPQR